MRNPFRSEGEMFRLVVVVIVGVVLIVIGAWINTWLGVAAAVLAVAGLVWWLMQEPVPGTADPAPRLDSGTPAGMHRVLVLATPGTSSVAVGDQATEVVVIVPALASKLEAATGAVDDRRAEAEQTALSLARSLARDGRSTRGEVGADDPVLAVEDALRTFGADEVLVKCDDDSVVDKIRARVAVPVRTA
jgi:hypothetical protein